MVICGENFSIESGPGMPRLPNRAQSATVVQPSRLDAAMKIAKEIPWVL